MSSYTLIETCYACPEQYDVFDGDRLVGYLRLRHGYFMADYPDVNGQCVYEADTIGDGRFDDSERDFHITAACVAIAKADGKVSH